MPGQLQSIVDLQKTNAELADARQRLEGIPDWMRELHEEHSSRKAEIDAVAAKRDEARQTRRTAEAALADAQEKAKHFQSQISQVSTQREYTALLKEIDTVKARIAELEKMVLDSIDSQDEAESQLGTLEDGFRELDERYRGELAKWEAEKPAVAASVEELSRRADEIRAKITRRILVLFDRIHERHGVQTIARIVKLKSRGGQTMWHCEACSYSVRPQVVVDIRNGGAVTQCDSCKRILYLEDGDG